MRRNSILAAIAALALGGLATGCKTVGASVNKAEAAAANTLIPIDQEKQLGKQIEQQVESQSKLLNDPTVVNYVNEIGQKLVANAENTKGYTFTFKVIDDPKTVNAFAIPGGTIYVYTGLLKLANNEAALAGVIGHEIAHVTQRHMPKRIVQQYGIESIEALALGRNPGLAAQIGTQILNQGYLLKNSRDDEREADYYGVITMSKAGYDPQQMVGFFSALKADEGKTPGVLAWLSDHPTTSERITNLQQEIQQKNLSGSTVNAEQYQAAVKPIS